MGKTKNELLGRDFVKSFRNKPIKEMYDAAREYDDDLYVCTNIRGFCDNEQCECFIIKSGKHAKT